MNRQQRRRIERNWRKIKVGTYCTEFIERNSLVCLHHIIDFRAVKLSEDLLGVYSVGVFDFKRDFGHGEFCVTYLFTQSSFTFLSSVQIAFIPEDDLWENEEIEI